MQTLSTRNVCIELIFEGGGQERMGNLPPEINTKTPMLGKYYEGGQDIDALSTTAGNDADSSSVIR
jgi:hypothetical protein